MARPYATFALLLMITAACCAALLSGAPFLEVSVLGAVPLGNIIAATFFLALGAAAFPLTMRSGAARRLAQFSLLLSASWLPVSAMLAGNLALNFAHGKGEVWLVYTGCVLVVALGAILVSVALRVVSARRQGGSV